LAPHRKGKGGEIAPSTGSESYAKFNCAHLKAAGEVVDNYSPTLENMPEFNRYDEISGAPFNLLGRKNLPLRRIALYPR